MNSLAPSALNNSNSKTPVNLYLPPPAQKRAAMTVTQTKLTPDSPIGALLPKQITYSGHGNEHQQRDVMEKLMSSPQKKLASASICSTIPEQQSSPAFASQRTSYHGGLSINEHQHQQSGGTPGNVTKSLVNIIDLRGWKTIEVP